MDSMTRQELVSKAADAGLAVGTWAPGDGHTRYRFFKGDDPGAGDYDSDFGLYTAHGRADAVTWLRGYRAARQTLLPSATDAGEGLAHAVLEWARTPGDHGGNPYCKPFVRLARVLLGDE